MSTNYIKYTSRIKSSTADGVLLEADQMKDESQGKLQSVINQENKTSIAAKANAADVYKKTETYTKSEVDTKVSTSISTVYKPKGSKATIAEVIALTNAKPGDVWNVETEFTLAGKKYPASTNVVCVTATTTSAHTDANWDALGGTVDLTPYAKSTDVNTLLSTKVDKVSGKDLSTNDYTTAEKTKLAGIEIGAQVNDVTSVAGRTGAVVLTKTDVGLGNVSNTTDAAKPISTATQTALNGKVDKVSGKGLSTNDYTTVEKTKLAGIEIGAQVNDVTSVAGRTGAVVLTKVDVGLSNVDNTSDASKPISTATQTALNSKANAADVYKKIETYTKSEVDTKVSTSISTVYKPKGSKATIAEVIALTNAKPGDVWNVEAEFTLAGKKYPASTNVVCVTATTTSAHTDANWDALGGTVDLTPYAKTADVNTKLAGKVDKVTGKGLSTNDYTAAEKTKLAGIAAGAQVNTVTSVAGKTGAVTLTKANVGLPNVDNTSDASKPISTATQTALNSKANIKNLPSKILDPESLVSLQMSTGIALGGNSINPATGDNTLDDYVTIPFATSQKAGIMIADDKAKLDTLNSVNRYDISIMYISPSSTPDIVKEALTPIGMGVMVAPKPGDMIFEGENAKASVLGVEITDSIGAIQYNVTIISGVIIYNLTVAYVKSLRNWVCLANNTIDLLALKNALSVS